MLGKTLARATPFLNFVDDARDFCPELFRFGRKGEHTKSRTGRAKNSQRPSFWFLSGLDRGGFEPHSRGWQPERLKTGAI